MYTIYCYFQDTGHEYIQQTKIRVNGPNTEYYNNSGDEQRTISNLENSWTATFTATPTSTGKFKSWTYRIGSTSATKQYSTKNPFTLNSGGQNIYIRAVGEANSGGGGGGGDTPTENWTLTSASIGNLSSEYSRSVSITNYKLFRYSVTFNSSGNARFYTSGSIDTMGLINQSTSWDSEDGLPITDLTYDHDSAGDGYNFDFYYNVTAGETYYIWVRGEYGDESGTATLHIQPPGTATISIEKWSWAKANEVATKAQVEAAYTAITHQGATSAFNFKVWNALVKKVIKILEIEDEDWYTTYATYGSTTMSTSNKTLTHARFNSLWKNINNHVSTGITERSAGDTVYGWYFTTLATCINRWIDSL